jgi:acetoin utilization protein AcuB
MTKPIPRVTNYMSHSPVSIGQEQTLAHAHRLMREHTIRHLPVLHGGKLVGLISDRDLHLIETLRDVNPEEVLVEEAMTASVYSVSPETPLDEAVGQMAEQKYGCAVVMDHGRVVGMFTTIDAMRALAELVGMRIGR